MSHHHIEASRSSVLGLVPSDLARTLTPTYGKPLISKFSSVWLYILTPHPTSNTTPGLTPRVLLPWYLSIHFFFKPCNSLGVFAISFWNRAWLCCSLTLVLLWRQWGNGEMGYEMNKHHLSKWLLYVSRLPGKEKLLFSIKGKNFFCWPGRPKGIRVSRFSGHPTNISIPGLRIPISPYQSPYLGIRYLSRLCIQSFF